MFVDALHTREKFSFIYKELYTKFQGKKLWRIARTQTTPTALLHAIVHRQTRFVTSPPPPATVVRPATRAMFYQIPDPQKPDNQLYLCIYSCNPQCHGFARCIESVLIEIAISPHICADAVESRPQISPPACSETIIAKLRKWCSYSSCFGYSSTDYALVFGHNRPTSNSSDSAMILFAAYAALISVAVMAVVAVMATVWAAVRTAVRASVRSASTIIFS